MKNNTNYLKAVFWDYPEYTDADKILEKIKVGNGMRNWILSRFLEYGRVIDTFKFFNISEISSEINKLRLRDFTRKKWIRMIEVYGSKGK